MWMIHFPGVRAKGSAKPSPGTVRKDGERLSGNITSLLCSAPEEQQAEMSVMLHSHSWHLAQARKSKCHTGNGLLIIFLQWWVSFDDMKWTWNKPVTIIIDLSYNILFGHSNTACFFTAPQPINRKKPKLRHFFLSFLVTLLLHPCHKMV